MKRDIFANTLIWASREETRVPQASGCREKGVRSNLWRCISQPFPLTCDVVEVVETVEVQAAGLFVGGFWTLAPHAGRPQDVSCPHSAVGPGAGLETETAF